MSSLTKTALLSNDALNTLFEETKQYVTQAVVSGCAAHEVERTIIEQILKIGNQLLGYFFKLQGNGDVGDKLDLSEGKCVKRLKQSTRIYRSLLGDFKLTRYGYGVRDKQVIACYPLDTRLQLPEEECSYPLQEIFHLLTTEIPYRTACNILKKLFNIKTTVDSMERINHHSSKEVSDFRAAQQKVKPEKTGELFIITADGKGVPIRHAKDSARIVDQRLKSPGSKPDRKRMAVVGASYTIDHFIRTPNDILEALFSEPSLSEIKRTAKRPIPKNKQVVAYLTQTRDGVEVKASKSTFSWLSSEIQRKSLASEMSSKPILAMMDGQESLWNQVKQLKEAFPDKKWVEILDLMHVNSYLWDAACAFYSGDKRRQLLFMKTNVLAILEGKVTQVINELRARAIERSLNKSLQATVVKVCRYFEKNQHRMQYHEYLKAGYPIATGVIEGACRHYVKDRMERAGMRWTIAGAQAMLDMRSVSLNGDCDKFNQFRISQQIKKQYPYAKSIGAINWPFAA